MLWWLVMSENERPSGSNVLATTEEAAAFLRQSEVTIRRKLASGQLRGVKLGGSATSPWRIPLRELERYTNLEGDED
jgi:excisionase family DNA binding protein